MNLLERLLPVIGQVGKHSLIRDGTAIFPHLYMKLLLGHLCSPKHSRSALSTKKALPLCLRPE